MTRNKRIAIAMGAIVLFALVVAITGYTITGDDGPETYDCNPKVSSYDLCIKYKGLDGLMDWAKANTEKAKAKKQRELYTIYAEHPRYIYLCDEYGYVAMSYRLHQPLNEASERPVAPMQTNCRIAVDSIDVDKAELKEGTVLLQARVVDPETKQQVQVTWPDSYVVSAIPLAVDDRGILVSP